MRKVKRKPARKPSKRKPAPPSKRKPAPPSKRKPAPPSKRKRKPRKLVPDTTFDFGANVAPPAPPPSKPRKKARPHYTGPKARIPRAPIVPPAAERGVLHGSKGRYRTRVWRGRNPFDSTRRRLASGRIAAPLRGDDRRVIMAGKYQNELGLSDFIELCESLDFTQHEAYTLWYSP